MAQDRLEVDVLVLGAGMSGLTAAARSAQAGLQVLVVEKAPEPGGSAALSEGFVWTAPTMEALFREDPDIDSVLGRALVDTLPRELDWLRSLGVEIQSGLTGVLGFGAGSQIDVAAYIARCTAIIESNGGYIVTNAAATELARDGGRVTGAWVETPDGVVLVSAGAVVLATGGFHANPELRKRYLHPSGDRLLLRANRYSAGCGLRLALTAGAALSEDMSGFYGCLVPHPLDRELSNTDFTALVQYHSERGILVDRDGTRFCDESLGDRVSARDVLQSPGGTAVLLADERIRVQYVLVPFVPGMDNNLDKFELARRVGAHFASAPTWVELARTLDAWGVDGARAVDTVTRYNRNVGAGIQPSPPRERHAAALVTPPFFALEVQPAITMTYGGIRVDNQGRVLDAKGHPIPSLYAIGFDSGGLYRRGYAGGLARAVVTAVLATEAIVAARVPASP